LIVVISGPGGVGKGTLVTRFCERNPNFTLRRSWTTRDRRPGESSDAYEFVTEEEFQGRVDSDGFVEWVPFLDYRQGTPKLPDDTGDDVLLEIDVRGAEAIREIHGDQALLIFVDAPSRDEQRRRMETRGDGPDRIADRLRLADAELAHARALGMHEITNRDIDQAVLEIEALIDGAR
jgi:guanylate kinase